MKKLIIFLIAASLIVGCESRKVKDCENADFRNKPECYIRSGEK